MRTKLIIAILLTTLLLTSCKHGYKVENNKVYYENWNEGSGQGKLLIEQADAKSFQKIEFDCDCSFDFGKDNNHLYIDGKKIRDIDPKTFKYLGNYIFADKDSAYFFGFYNNINDCAIKGIDIKKLQFLQYPWSKSGNILIHGYDTLTLSDIKCFVPLDEDWGMTKRYVINKNKILKNADPESFKVINSFSGKDKNYTYEFGEIKK